MISRLAMFVTMIGLVVCPCLGRVSEGWSQLKLGMSIPQAREALGDPLVKTAGRGYEQWIYDGRAEVLFYRGVGIGWATPVTESSTRQVVDVWQREQSWLGLFQLVFPILPVRVTPPWRSPEQIRGKELPLYQQRIRR